MGDGNSILVWEDPWILGCPLFQLFTQDKMGWDVDKLKAFFDIDTVNAIKNIPIAIGVQPHRWAWTKTTTGEFSIKSVYWSGRSLGEHEVFDQLYGNTWKMQLHERLKMLLWRISSNVLPTKDRIGRFSNDHFVRKRMNQLFICLHNVIWLEPYGLEVVGCQNKRITV